MCDAIKHDCVCLYTPIVAPSSGQAEAASFVRATQDECDSLHSIKASLFVLSLFMCPPHVLFNCIVARVFSRGRKFNLRNSEFLVATDGPGLRCPRPKMVPRSAEPPGSAATTIATDPEDICALHRRHGLLVPDPLARSAQTLARPTSVLINEV